MEIIKFHVSVVCYSSIKIYPFYILMLYSETLINSVMRSSHFFVDALGFSVDRVDFTSFFLNMSIFKNLFILGCAPSSLLRSFL